MGSPDDSTPYEPWELSVYRKLPQESPGDLKDVYGL